MLEQHGWLHGKPHATGVIKAAPEDFIVTEDLGYAPDGEGEQLLVRIRKTGCNTRFVAEALAKYLRVPQRDLSFAGMKDRHAVTEQTLCFRLPGKEMPDLSGFHLEGCEILGATRHKRKLRTGALAGNAFRLVIRRITQPEEIAQRLEKIRDAGVPNYFGEQRFGRDGHNLTMARQWARNEIQVRDRNKRSLILSAARSALFNQVVSDRLRQQDNLTDVVAGDALQLTGRGSWFVAQPEELSVLQQRVLDNELRVTAPLAGRGEPGTQLAALALEQQSLAATEELITLLERERVDAARRAMLVIPRDMRWNWLDEATLEMTFWLPAGSFATSVVRELLQQEGDDADIAE